MTTQFSGLVMAYETQSEEAFLTTQQVDEARHAQHFNRFYEQVLGLDGTFESRLEHARRELTDDFVTLFDDHLVEAGKALRRRPARHRGQGRLRDDLPHGDRGHARADRPELHHPRVRGARHPAGLPRGLPQDLAPTSTATSPTARGSCSRRPRDPGAARGASPTSSSSCCRPRRECSCRPAPDPARLRPCSATAPRRSTTFAFTALTRRLKVIGVDLGAAVA